jgi:hypothetical protein
MTEEDDFTQAMMQIYIDALRECGYKASRFRQMVEDERGVATARRLLASDQPQYGFVELWEHNRLDLTVERLVLQERWRHLFTNAELAEARDRLRAHNYEI